MHTPGPWHKGLGNGEGKIFSEKGRMRLEDEQTTLYAIAIVGKGWDEAEDEANASLIAAAPELLDALQEIVRNVDLWRTADNMAGRIYSIADAAIKKATVV